jgi:hypothetical protein
MKVYVGMVTGHDGFYDVGAADTLERARNKTLKDVIEAFGDRGYVWVNYTKHNISHLYEREELERPWVPDLQWASEEMSISELKEVYSVSYGRVYWLEVQDADPVNPHVLSILSKTGYNDDGTSYNMYRATCACGEWKSPPRHTYERAEEMGKTHLVAKGFPV